MLKTFQSTRERYEMRSSTGNAVSAEDAILALQMALKCADMGRFALGWSSHLQWVRRLQAEFFAQGDKEKMLGIEVSMLMDREKVSESQVGVLKFIVLPLFKTFVGAFPSSYIVLETVEQNFQQWCNIEAA